MPHRETRNQHKFNRPACERYNWKIRDFKFLPCPSARSEVARELVMHVSHISANNYNPPLPHLQPVELSTLAFAGKFITGCLAFNNKIESLALAMPAVYVSYECRVYEYRVAVYFDTLVCIIPAQWNSQFNPDPAIAFLKR